ncbi:MAG: DUF1194 domain-containing protein [Rhizobiales bacterium]|nr:DUF1194 domain-containing protein [Hyphomicrobiales bacterium]
MAHALQHRCESGYGFRARPFGPSRNDRGGRLRHWLVCWSRVAALLIAAGSPAAAQTQVDLQLVLAVDASGSVSHQRFELQKRGYIAAFRHPQILQAILSGLNQSIAVTMMQWTGPALQVITAKWTLINDVGSIRAFADAIDQTPRQLFGGGTSISGALDTGVALLNDSPYKSARRIIDVSGDGANNRGRPVTRARDEAVAARIGINGLPILAIEPDLDKYYEDNVIGGPGAFVVAAKDYETFADAILKKLITEIAGMTPGKVARK